MAFYCTIVHLLLAPLCDVWLTRRNDLGIVILGCTSSGQFKAFFFFFFQASVQLLCPKGLTVLMAITE